MTDAGIVRIVLAGSVDDGKSTLIGRLLYDSDAILEDQLSAVKEASEKSGEDVVNLALLTDGLRDERAQKITIDVAYRHFSSSNRRYLLADTPGHAQYTRNMFTGASTADIAIILIDAERGPTDQTRRHLFIASLLRVPHVIVCINKMDLVGYEEAGFEQRCLEIREFTTQLQFGDLRFVPVSAHQGQNVVHPADKMPWYTGQTLLETLDKVELTARQSFELRFLIQTVIRPNQTLRGYLGEAVSGSIRTGETLSVYPQGSVATVANISTPDGTLPEAETRQPVVVELQEDIDIARGTILARSASPPSVTQSIETTVCWMSAEPVDGEQKYIWMSNGQEATCQISRLHYRIDLQTLHRQPDTPLDLNELGKLELTTSTPIVVDPYSKNRTTGSFILVNPRTNEVAAAGIVTRINESQTHRQDKRATVVWMTGLSGAGKTTLAQSVRSGLEKLGIPTVVLDGDTLRAGLNRDLGFSQEDRTENNRRTAEVAKLLADQGYTVICALISPLQTQRDQARDIIGSPFQEVYVRCSLETAAQRDPKGFYQKASAGEIKDFTGIASEYEPPTNPDLEIDTQKESESDSAQKLLTFLRSL